jgi:hypothetical protein
MNLRFSRNGEYVTKAQKIWKLYGEVASAGRALLIYQTEPGRRDCDGDLLNYRC